MKLSELRACDCCNRPLTEEGRQHITFYRLKVERMFLKPQAINRTLGLAQIFQGMLGLAEAMSPDPEAAEALPRHNILILCDDCGNGMHEECLPMAVIVEKADRKKRKEDP